MRFQLLVITIIFLCTMTPILSTSKDREVRGNKNTQNMEKLLSLNPNQSQHGEGLQDQQDTFEKAPNQTSQYIGVQWDKDAKKWKARLTHNNKKSYGGLFDDEKQAAMKINLLCDKNGIERKNPMINLEPDAMQQFNNQTSIYSGVCWQQARKKWQAQLSHNKKKYHAGYFDNEEQAAMKINLLCDENEIERKNPTIDIELNVIQQVPNPTSQYNGVSWDKDAKQWKAQFTHNKKQSYVGLFNNEEQAAMQINLLCDKYEIRRKNPTINLKPDATRQQFKNQTSIYNGVCWHRDNKKWQARLKHKKKVYHGGLFDNEEQAAMKVNLLCDKNGVERKNPMIDIKSDAIKQVPNQTSQYNGVSWHKNNKKWQVQLIHNQKQLFGGYFDNEEQAAMKVNLLCDKNGIERKNPMIIIKTDVIQQVPNQTSQYVGVSRHHANKWEAKLTHKKKKYYGGLFDNEEHAAMKVNLFCDKNGIERKNPSIDVEPDVIEQVPNHTSQYTGVYCRKDSKKWQAYLKHNQKLHYGGLFDNEEQAAMQVNLLCEKNGIDRKNPMIDLEPDAMQQQSKNQTSNYSGVCWHRDKKKWQASLTHNKNKYYGGLFGNEEHAAMQVNLLCDKYGIKRQNPMIDIKMEEKIKIATTNQ